jgi:hypothetical protein
MWLQVANVYYIQGVLKSRFTEVMEIFNCDYFQVLSTFFVACSFTSSNFCQLLDNFCGSWLDIQELISPSCESIISAKLTVGHSATYRIRTVCESDTPGVTWSRQREVCGWRDKAAFHGYGPPVCVLTAYSCDNLERNADIIDHK